ncbi:MAG: response regulator [Treponema sp.]|nr:response regulator [Treponema sp.]
MKSVLLIDASPLFREFLKEKLTRENIQVEIAQGKRDAFIKTNSLLPDLIILDITDTFADITDFLDKKRNDPNARKIPIIVSGPHIDNAKLSLLVQFGVIKYFTKPIKFDLFFEAIGTVLRQQFSIDITPSRIELHLNNNIIFLEIALGLNREKIAILRYKLTELITSNKLDNPKMIIMITDTEFSFVDGANIEYLFDCLLSDKRLEKKNIKVLSFDTFVTDFIDGHVSLKGIEVSTNLTNVINSLVDSIGSTAEDIQTLILDKVLKADKNVNNGSVEMRFLSDTNTTVVEEKKEGQEPRIAILDTDPSVKNMLTTALRASGYKYDLYDSGMDFLNGLGKHHYDVAIIDILISGLSGFEILKQIKQQQKHLPVIVHSPTSRKMDIVQLFTLGAALYLPKPQKPEIIVQKIKELLNGNPIRTRKTHA